MTKTQKILLWTGLALFAIPEILWSPVGNMVYGILQNSNDPALLRESVLFYSDKKELLIFVLVLQAIGMFTASVTGFFCRNVFVKIIASAGTVLAIGVVILAIALFSLRNIGF